jgi:hypothetical protein
MSEDDGIDRSDWPPEMIEEDRVERLTSPLFDMWLEFERAFAAKAIDDLDVSDEDAEKAAAQMTGASTSGAAFAHLLRHVQHERILRDLHRKVVAVFATLEHPHGMSITEIHAEYAKLQKGEA